MSTDGRTAGRTEQPRVHALASGALRCIVANLALAVRRSRYWPTIASYPLGPFFPLNRITETGKSIITERVIVGGAARRLTPKRINFVME